MTPILLRGSFIANRVASHFGRRHMQPTVTTTKTTHYAPLSVRKIVTAAANSTIATNNCTMGSNICARRRRRTTTATTAFLAAFTTSTTITTSMLLPSLSFAFPYANSYSVNRLAATPVRTQQQQILLINNNQRQCSSLTGIVFGRSFSTTARSVSRSKSSSSDQELSNVSLEEEEEGDEELASSEYSNTFASSYHAPVMWRECIDALLARDDDSNESNTYKKKRREKYKKKRLEEEVTEGGEEVEEELSATNEQQQQQPEKPQRPRIFVDGTCGGGGHSEALLQELQLGDIVFGCDVDPEALKTAEDRLRKYMNAQQSVDGSISDNKNIDSNLPLFIPVRSNFSSLHKVLPKVLHPHTNEPILKRLSSVDGILLDLGVSSHQIDTAERGFAFMKEGPLDMRMGYSSNSNTLADDGSLTAADICNEFDLREIQDILKHYGDEPRAKSISHAIVERRPLKTTTDLVQAVAAVTPQFAKKSRRLGRTATLARVFQSLRIVVNQEDEVLQQALLKMAPALLRPGGRLVVLSYHSMEDRAAKRAIRDGTLHHDASVRRQERDLFGNLIGKPKPFRAVGKKQKASEKEVGLNPRSRSATLRVAEKQATN